MQHIIQTMYHFDKPMAVYLRSHIDQSCIHIFNWIDFHYINNGNTKYHIILRRYICSLGCGICSMESDWCRFLGKPSKVYKYFLDAGRLGLVCELCKSKFLWVSFFSYALNLLPFTFPIPSRMLVCNDHLFERQPVHLALTGAIS